MAFVSLALAALVPFAWTLISRLSPTLRRQPTPETPMLAYRVEGGTVLEGGYLRESGGGEMNVLFNEGSTVTFARGTRGRVHVVDRDNARVAIERGRASFHVQHRSDRRWSVDAGPFLVTVTGTVFTVSWDPAGEELELALREGSVVVKGPVSAGDIALRAGQRLVSNLGKVTTVITEDAAERAGGQPDNGALGSSALPPAREPPAEAKATAALPGPAEAKPSRERQWSKKLAQGQWDQILREAERGGVMATLDEASRDDLFALANAARYRRRLELARGALLAERRRFPEGGRAAEAVYLLGRVEEARPGGLAQALAWYDEYLARAPGGPLAGEALGRKMTLVDRLSRTAEARALAEEYLRRFPKGNYAGSARQLLSP
jgi:TolA-binding protein